MSSYNSIAREHPAVRHWAPGERGRSKLRTTIPA